jgi:DNA-binding transcriptional LysR family regulator
VLRTDHPALARKWTLELFAGLDHVLVSLLGRGGGHVDEALAAHGLRRRIALRLPYPALAPSIVAETDLVVTTPRWLALKLASSGELVVRRPPLPIPPVRIALVWHERSHRDPRQRWLREALSREAGALDRKSLAW